MFLQSNLDTYCITFKSESVCHNSCNFDVNATFVNFEGTPHGCYPPRQYSEFSVHWATPTPVDKLCLHDEAYSKASRTDAAEMTVASGPVVEHFNVIEDILPGHITCYIYVFPEPFFFQRTEERFGHRIDAPMSRAGDWHM